MTETTETLVTFLLDKSNSMASVKAETIGAFNTYLHGLQAETKGISFSLLLFDTLGLITVARNVPVAQADTLTAATYQPEKGASTPLIDAAVKTIKGVEKLVAERKGKPKVVVCIQTDGEENSSREYTWDDLKRLVDEKTEAGWQFNFMGCGIDAYLQGARMGISVANTVSYSVDQRSTTAAFAAMSVNTTAYASGARGSTAYTTAQKRMSGDKFDPAHVGGAPATPGVPKPPKPIIEEPDLS
jgi:hypothetical protein